MYAQERKVQIMDIAFIHNYDAEFSMVMKIRNDVFGREQGAIVEEEIDVYDNDKSTIYMLIYDEMDAVATGRIAITPKGYKIGRIAVSKSQRGRGIGAVLVNGLCEKANEMGAKHIFVDAQLHAIPFYEKLGFAPTGESEIVDRGIVHLPMRK